MFRLRMLKEAGNPDETPITKSALVLNNFFIRIGVITASAIISESRGITNKLSCRRVVHHKALDLTTSIFFSRTGGAVSLLNVLSSIGATPEPHFATKGTTDVSRIMHLHMLT